MNDSRGGREFERDGLPISWVMASFSLLVGITMTYVPYGFEPSLSHGIDSHIRWLGLGFLGGGVLFWLSVLYPRAPRLIGGLGRIGCVVSLLSYGYREVSSNGSDALPGAMLYPVLLAGFLAELSPRLRGWGLFSLFIAASSGCWGLLMLALPGRLSWVLQTETSPVAHLWAAVCLLGALGLICTLSGRYERVRRVFFGLLALPLGGGGYLLGGSWPTMELYFILGVACVLAALGPRLRRFIAVRDPGSVRLRLGRDMAVGSILPLIAMGGVASFLFQRAIVEQIEAAAVGATEAGGAASSVFDARAQVAAATLPGLLGPADAVKSDQPTPQVPLLDHQVTASVSGRDSAGGTQRDLGAIYAPIARFGLAAMAVLAVATVLSLILSGLVATSFTARLAVVRTAAGQLVAGDRSRPAPPGEVDEIDALARAFDEMAEQMVASQTELAERNEELERAVAARETFMAIASHELRTPLTPLRLTVDGLKARLSAGAVDERRLGRGLDLMGRQVDRLEMLVEQLLDVSWLRAGHFSLAPTPFDLARLVDHVVERYRQRSAIPLIELECEGRPLEGHWDPDRLEQLLTQLIDNAIRYSPLHTPIQVSLSGHDGEVELRVADQGIGIPPDTLPYLFQLFQRGANASPTHFGGLGLGLYICREIVERHGGRIWAESEGPDCGSTFCVVLPWCPPSSALSPAAAVQGTGSA